MSSRVYNRVGVNRIGRSVFDLSYSKKFTGYFGYLYPSMVDEVVPGDVFDISKQIVVRLMPMVAPILHEVNLYEYTFFVSYELLMSEELGDDGSFSDMLRGGSDGDTEIAIPTWEPTTYTLGSLWDYMGFPVGVDPDGAYPVDFPKRAYNLIFNEYFRDEDLETELDITTSEIVKTRAWEKDYFTSCRPWQQRGTSPAMPLSGTLTVDPDATGYPEFKKGAEAGRILGSNASVANAIFSPTFAAGGTAYWDDAHLEVDISSGVTFDVNDIRLAVQVQRWMERNARAGTRYVEYIKSHFDVNVRDERSHRPEYIGGMKSPVIISEVLQTESSDASTDLGTMAGHGIAVAQKHIGKYRVKEYGLIMSIFSVLPRTAYSQGIDRQWRKDTLYDFYVPEFADLSEQEVLRSEVYASGVESENDTVFAF